MSPPPTFPGIKVLQQNNIHRNIGGTTPSPTSILSATVRIIPERIIGPRPQVLLRAADNAEFELVTGDFTAPDGAVHTFAVPGPKIDLRIVGSATKIQGLDSEGKLTSTIIVRVGETI